MANRRTVSEHPTTDEEKIRLNIAVEVTVRAINNRNEIPIVIIRKLLGLHLGRARFASEGGAPNEDTRLTRGGVLTPREVQLHST